MKYDFIKPHGIPLSADISIIHYWDAKQEDKTWNVEKYFDLLFHCGFIIQCNDFSRFAGLLVLRCLLGRWLPSSPQVDFELRCDRKHQAIKS